MQYLSFFSSYGMDDAPNAYLFGPIHFTYIIICIMAFFLLMKFFLHQSQKVKRIFLNILLVLMLALKYGGEIIFVSEYYLYDSPISSHTHSLFSFETLISFQLCGINNILLPLVIWLNIKPMKDFVYTTSIMGGIAVMLYPVGVLYGDPFALTFVMLRSLIVHFLLVFIPCFLIADRQFTLETKNWKYTLLGCGIVYIWAMFGNLIVDPTANDMYLMENPFFNGPIPVLNIIPDGWHLIPLLSLVFLGFVLIYHYVLKYQEHRDDKEFVNEKA